MLNMHLENVTAMLVQQFLIEPKGVENKAIHFHFNVRVDSFESNEQFGSSVGLHLLYHLKPRSTYVDVFSGATNRPFAKLNEVEGWTHEASHDSGWRNLNVFSQIYFSLAGEVNDQRKSSELKEIAPKDMSQSAHLRISRKMFDWVDVEVKVDGADPMKYHRTLTIK